MGVKAAAAALATALMMNTMPCMAAVQYEAYINDNGALEYSTEHISDGAQSYFAIYEADGRLREVFKGSESGAAQVNTGKEYKTALYIWDKENRAMQEKQTKTVKNETIYKTVKPQLNGGAANVELSGTSLKFGDGTEISMENTAVLADKSASEQTQRLYNYLKAVAKSKAILFGQENNLTHKAGSRELSEADTYDVTGDYAAVFGIDTLSLTGDEFSADTCNYRYGTSFANTARGNVEAAAYVTNRAAKNGAIITLSSHMPDFARVPLADEVKGEESYAKYNFSGYYPNPSGVNTAKQVLPNGALNEVYRAYLDMSAEFMSMLDVPVIYRPLHECTGGWFWWGVEDCDDETYKALYAYTVEYMKGKDLHNVIYAYSPGSEPKSIEDYERRYPGDEYVDILGLDTYDRSGGSKVWFKELKEQIELLNEFSKKHNKLMALTETGISHETAQGDNQTALLRSGNENLSWYSDLWNALGEYELPYIMVWSNFSERDGFYTPYVKKINEDGSLFCHEMTQEFVNFYNKEYSIFASNQREVCGRLLK